jgi:hypothetical protein
MRPSRTTIFKYDLDLTDRQEIKMPRTARILTSQVQRGAMVLWAEVDADAPREIRVIWIVGTGNPMPPAGAIVNYISSVQLGDFLWHVYEEARR